MLSSNAIGKQELDVLAQVGHAISVSRRARNWRQKDLADLAGIGMNTMGAIEKGSPTVLMGHYIKVLSSLGRLDLLRQAAAIGGDEVAAEAMALTLPKRVTGSHRRRN